MSQDATRCPACNVLITQHLGLYGTCGELLAARAELDALRNRGAELDEGRLERAKKWTKATLLTQWDNADRLVWMLTASFHKERELKVQAMGELRDAKAEIARLEGEVEELRKGTERFFASGIPAFSDVCRKCGGSGVRGIGGRLCPYCLGSGKSTGAERHP